MATDTLQPGTAPANPSRRTAIGILATAPIAVLPALAVMQCSEPARAATTGQLQWDRLIAAEKTARDAHNTYWDTVVLAADARYVAARGSLGPVGMQLSPKQEEWLKQYDYGRADTVR